MMRVFLSVGGPDLRIQVEGTIYTFEDHPWAGPTVLDGGGRPLDKQPMNFLLAASYWVQQGRKVDDEGLAIWYHPAVPITSRINSKNVIVTGWHEPIKGE